MNFHLLRLRDCESGDRSRRIGAAKLEVNLGGIRGQFGGEFVGSGGEEWGDLGGASSRASFCHLQWGGAAAVPTTRFVGFVGVGKRCRGCKVVVGLYTWCIRGCDVGCGCGCSCDRSCGNVLRSRRREGVSVCRCDGVDSVYCVCRGKADLGLGGQMVAEGDFGKSRGFVRFLHKSVSIRCTGVCHVSAYHVLFCISFGNFLEPVRSGLSSLVEPPEPSSNTLYLAIFLIKLSSPHH